MYDTAIMDHEVKDLNILHFQQSLEHHEPEPEDYTKFYYSKMTIVDAEIPKFIVNQTSQDFAQEEIIVIDQQHVDYCEDKSTTKRSSTLIRRDGISGVTAKEPKIKKVNTGVGDLLICKGCSYSTNKTFNMNRHIRTSKHRRIIQDDANVPNISMQRLGPVAPAAVVSDNDVICNVLSDQVIVIPEPESSITERASPITKVSSPDQPVFEEVMSCSLCDFVASSTVALRSHARLEHPDKPRRESARIRKVISYKEDEVDEYECEKNSSSSYEDDDEVNEDELTDESDYSTNYYSSSFVRNKRTKFYSPPRPSLINVINTNDLGASTNYSKLSQNEGGNCSKFVNNSNNLQSSEEFFSPISVKNELQPELGEFKELNNIEVHDAKEFDELGLFENDKKMEDLNRKEESYRWQDFLQKIKGETSTPSPLFYTCTICHLIRTKCKYNLMSHLKIKHPEIARKINWNLSQEEETTQEASDDLVHSDVGDSTKETKELVKNVLYSCKICFYIAKSKSNLKKHIYLEHHNSAADCSSKEPIKMKVKRGVLLTCNICFYTTNKGYNLTRHTKSVHNNIPKPRKKTRKTACPKSKDEPISSTPVTKENVQQVLFSCNFCTFSTNRKLDLQGHINMVHDDNISDDRPSCRNELKETRNSSKNGLFTCKICFYTTKKGCNLKRHTKNAKCVPKQDGNLKRHTKNAKCVPKQDGNLKRHTKNAKCVPKQDGENVSNTITSGQQDCNLCTFSTKYGKAGLKRHMESMHGGPKKPKIKTDGCDLCGKKYYSRYSLKMHMVTHFLQDSPHQCQICLKKFASIWSLKKHLATRHNDSGLPDVAQFLCSFCGKGFTLQTGLTSHTLTHTGEKPYPCTECPKRFVTREHLVQHLSSSVHRNELRYSCDTCGRKFNKISNMQTHLKTHLNEKPFQCISCKKWFSRMDNMKNHMKRVHNLTASTAVEQPE